MSRGSRHLQIKNIAKSKTTLYRTVLAVSVIEPLFTVPQIIQIWVSKQTAGVSIWTWTFYGLFSWVWLFYGIKVKSKPIIISSMLWVLLESTVVVGVLLKR